MTSCKRQYGAWIVGLIMATPILYVLSFGPACWWFPKSTDGVFSIAPDIYWPIGKVAIESRLGMAYDVIGWYATLASTSRVIIEHDTEHESFGVAFYRKD